MDINWQEYEDEVLDGLKEMYPGAKIARDVKIKGRYSGVKRQIDILIEAEVAGFRTRIVVDAKYMSRRIDVKGVECFISKVDDVGATHGLLVTKTGYSKGAIERAHRDPRDIELDVLSVEELEYFQAFGAIPYSGDRGILVPAPFGWVVDARPTPTYLAEFHQRGLTLEEAHRNWECMYVNLWHKDKTAHSIQQLAEWQANQMKDVYTNLCTAIDEGPARRDGRATLIRTATSDELPCTEITGYIDFDDFIPFFVLFTVPQLAAKNVRKLKYVLHAAVPIQLSYQDGRTIRRRSEIPGQLD